MSLVAPIRLAAALLLLAALSWNNTASAGIFVGNPVGRPTPTRLVPVLP